MSVRERPVERIACGLPLVTKCAVFGLDPIPSMELEPDAEVGDLRELGTFVERPMFPTLYRVLWEYLHEHCVPNTGNERRAAGASWDWIEALGSDFDVRTIARGDGRTVIDYLQRRGLKPGSVKRIMSVGVAALNHAKREGRITEVPKFPRVRGGSPRVRWLSREEHRRLMLAPKPKRLHDFYIIAFATGARSEAIEQLTCERVDFSLRTIDFRLPNKDHRNKRRAIVPISDSLLPRLQRMCESKKPDEPVIGYGPSGRLTSTYHQAKALMRSLGIDEYGVARHVARHTVASWMLQGDPERGIVPAPIQHVAQLLGDTVGMVERVYGHVLPKHLLDATRILP